MERDEEVRLPVASHGDIVTARSEGRRLAAEMGFSLTEIALIITAISELARNIVQYAGKGEITLKLDHANPHPGLVIIASDQGRGIADLRRALMDGYSTSGGLGMGLPGVKRLMDEFAIQSEIDKGTTITAKKRLWSNKR